MKATAGLHHPLRQRRGARLPEPALRRRCCAHARRRGSEASAAREQRSLRRAAAGGRSTPAQAPAVRERLFKGFGSLLVARAGGRPAVRWGGSSDARLRGAGGRRSVRARRRPRRRPERARPRARRALAQRVHGARPGVLDRGSRAPGRRRRGRLAAAGDAVRGGRLRGLLLLAAPRRRTSGRMFRPDAEPLLPNWRHLPVGYHGRAGTVVPSGTPVRRPQRAAGRADFGPSRRLDIELEAGFVIGHAEPSAASPCRSSGRSTTCSAWCS